MHIFQIFLALFVLQCLAAVIALADYFVWFVGLRVHGCQFAKSNIFWFRWSYSLFKYKYHNTISKSRHRILRASLLLSYFFGIRIKDIFKSDNTISRGRDRGTLSILEPPHSRYECCLHSRTPVAPPVNGICDTVTFLQYNLSRKDISTIQPLTQRHFYNATSPTVTSLQ